MGYWVNDENEDVRRVTRRLTPEVVDALDSAAERLAHLYVVEQEPFDDNPHYIYDNEHAIYLEERNRIVLEVLAECQSPIEHRMAIALEKAIAEEVGVRVCRYTITPQFSVQTEHGKYRIDLVVDYSPVSDVEITIGVECDGHEWHDRTPAQAARDKSRDRALSERGFPVLRFTGSEIVRDADGCARQVLQILKAMWNQSKKTGEVFSLHTIMTMFRRLPGE